MVLWGGGDSGLSQNDGAGLMGASFIKRCMTFCVSQKGTQRFIKRGVFQKGGNIDTSWFPYVIRVYKNKFGEIHL